MTSLSARNKANKAKGADFEISLVQFFREKFLNAERLVKTGREDEGDLVLRIKDFALVVEAKNEKAIDLSGYLREAQREALHYEAHRVHEPTQLSLVLGAAAVKRRNHGIEKTYIVMEADDVAALLLHLQTR